MSSTNKTEYALSALYEISVTGERKPVKYKTGNIWPNNDQALNKKVGGYISRRYIYTKI